MIRLYAIRLNLRGGYRLARLAYPPDRRSQDYFDYIGCFDNVLFHIDTRSYVEWYIHMFGAYDLPTLAPVLALTRHARTVFDVGANVGAITIPVAARLAPGATVHAFEPHPRVVARLRDNIRLNGLVNVRVNPIALGSSRGTATLFGSLGGNLGTSSLRSTHDIGSTQPFDVAVDTLDAYVGDAEISRVDVIKMDVQGAELEILRGSQTLIRGMAPVIFLEASQPHLSAFQSSQRDLYDFLKSSGYDLWLNRTSRNGAIRCEPLTSPERSPLVANWLALPRPR